MSIFSLADLRHCQKSQGSGTTLEVKSVFGVVRKHLFVFQVYDDASNVVQVKKKICQWKQGKMGREMARERSCVGELCASTINMIFQ